MKGIKNCKVSPVAMITYREYNVLIFQAITFDNKEATNLKLL